MIERALVLSGHLSLALMIGGLGALAWSPHADWSTMPVYAGLLILMLTPVTRVVIACALFPMSLLLNWLLMPHLSTWNVALRVALSTIVIVPWMVWAGVPWVSRWLKPWLTGGRR